MRQVRKLAMFLLVAGVGMAVATEATAQEPPMQAAPAIEVTPELLERFVDVYPSVMEVAQSAQAQMASVETAEEAQAIQADAQQQIAAVLEEGEVTAEEYEAVVTRLNQDEELRTEFEAMLEARMQEPDGF